MDTNYMLVNSIDPTKCRTKVREKFAKLTLSSNKKKQEDAELLQQQIREQSALSNVSRNLLSELLTDDESEGETEPQQPQETVNRILRTDSSPSESNVEPYKTSHNSTDITHCSEVENNLDKSMEMEPLLVSEIENTEVDINEEIEKLSSRVSSLAVEVHPPIPTVLCENSLIISTESQKMTSGQKMPEVLKVTCKKECDETICIMSTSSEDESAITILDSSEDEEKDYVHNVSPAVTTNLPEALDTVKADRMAAFLRDVRRNYGLPVDTPERILEERQREMAAADTEPMTGESDSRSGVDTEKVLARADTESMTERDYAVEKEPPTTPRDKNLAMEETVDNTKASESLQSSALYLPVMNVNPQLLDESIQKSSSSIPDDSLTIAETTEEEINESYEASTPDTQNELKRSDSPAQPTSRESSESCEQDNQIQINFSAKISIQIQVSQQMEESTSSGSVTTSEPNDVSADDSNNSKTHSSAQKAQNQSKVIEEIPHSPPERDIPMESPNTVNKSPDNFIDEAQRLLTELYGDRWKTPKVMRSLKKPTARKKPPLTVPRAAIPQQELKDESVLDDFSIFRRNIPQDLDSTRLPITPVCTFKVPKPSATDTKPSSRSNNSEKSQQLEITKTKSGREVRQRWRTIVDSDTESEGENASDDQSKSWTKSDSEDDVEQNSPVFRSKKRTKSKPLTKDKSARYMNEADEEVKENIPIKRPAKRTKPKANAKNECGKELVYLDLSKDEVEVQHDVSVSPPANHDEKFDLRLQEILKTCEFEGKPKLECTPSGKTKRKLFTANLNDDDENVTVHFDSPKELPKGIDGDNETVSISGVPMPAKFEPFNKYLESVKTGKPIFKIQTPKSKSEGRAHPVEISSPKTPKSASNDQRVIESLTATPKDKYGFLKSLDACVAKFICHPDALYYRDNFRVKKSELADKLYEIYNKKLFGEKLNVPLQWNKKLTNTAGRCMNKKRLGERTCVIELSEKVLTSADRLRCTLIHELCHAATWIFNGEGGHGATWKSWAAKANQVFPELPKIGVCHQYDIEYKYTYKCTLCGAKSNAHSKSKKVENIRCSYCHGAIEVFLNKKDKDGNVMATPVREPTGFAKFVKDKYKEYKRPDLKHADVMKLLSNEFASLKVSGKS